MAPALWGDLYQEGHPYPVRVTVHTSQSFSDRARRVLIVIRVEPHKRLWGKKSFWVEGQEVVVDFLIPEVEMYMSSVPEVIGLHFKKALEGFPKQVAPRLFEFDPRIGNVLQVAESRNETWLPSPLFDPPGGVRFPFPRPQIDAPLYARHYNQWGRCGKCKADLEFGAEVTWGGGHLLWVCRKCLPRETYATVR
jgi:hypothetical protein